MFCDVGSMKLINLDLNLPNLSAAAPISNGDVYTFNDEILKHRIFGWFFHNLIVLRR